MRLRHHPERAWRSAVTKGIGEGPVDLELAVASSWIGLVRPPAQLLHRFEQAADQLN